ncbi:hypothetical protein QT425_22530, partial [Xanthomonas citri pv. citri]
LAMDVQPRAPEYGARRHHACHEVGDGRLAPLLATARSGGITIERWLASITNQAGGVHDRNIGKQRMMKTTDVFDHVLF